MKEKEFLTTEERLTEFELLEHKRLAELEEARKPRYWWHWQNLKKDDDDKGRIGLHGRAWAHDRRGRAEINVEWHIPTSFWHLKVGLDSGDGNLEFAFGCGLVGIWLSFDGLRWLQRKDFREREISFSLHSGALWWHLWQDPNEWRSTDPKWRRGSFYPADFVLGRMKHSEVDLRISEANIVMPEKSYPVTVRLFTSIWKRPRWPWPKMLRRAEITTVDGRGVPVPGKGENSWDCDDSAIDAMIAPAQTIEEAIEAFVTSVNRKRLKYGGEGWQPDGKH